MTPNPYPIHSVHPPARAALVLPALLLALCLLLSGARPVAADTYAPTGPTEILSAGGYFTCALTPAGAVACWGDDDHGQAGVHAGPYSHVSAGGWHTCALTAGGAVECWGENDNGQVGSANGAHAGPYTQVSAGVNHTCALTPTGAVECWGSNGDGQAGAHAGPYTQVSAGNAYTCALTPAGAVECWGFNGYGQAGNHDGPYTQVSAGGYHTCALTPAGAVECWGGNFYGQAGNHAGPYSQVSAGWFHTCALTPAGAVECWGYNYYGQVGGAHVGPYSQVSGGAYHTCALTPAGAVECWGDNGYHQAGNHAGPYGPYRPPQLPEIVSAGAYHTCALTPAGAVECWGRNNVGQAVNHAGPYSQVSAGRYHTCALKPGGAVECWGNNGNGQVGGAHPGPYSQVSAGGYHTCALTPGGAVECWGRNDSSQAGNHAGPYVQVSAGLNHTCALRPSGAVECWGDNSAGQAGSAHAGPYIQVSAAWYYTCALTPSGAVECWGRNNYGQAGNHDGPYVQVSAGGYHTCARTPGGAVACWGYNYYGQADSHAGPDSQVSTGIYHTCALRPSGAVACWGQNNEGQAGNHAGPYGPYVPETILNAVPPNPTTSPDATFLFTSPDAAATFECRLDGGAWGACSSPTAYTGLAESAHTFEVRAISPPGNPDTTPAGHTWIIDATPPQTTIDTTPPNPSNGAGAVFTFSGDDGGGSGVASFRCRIDDGGWAVCHSGDTLGGLSDGSHTFEVRAVDAAGNSDPTPAGHTWTVDATAPVVTITGGPSGTVNTASATFEFSSESGATFACRLDGGAWGGCSSPTAYTGLGDGEHTFGVQATDAAGNTSAAAGRTWTVDATGPVVTITVAPADPTNSPNATLEFSSESGATFECRLDSGPWAACNSPQAYTGLSDSSHTFRVRATDALGNVGPEESRTWTVDTTPPETTIDTWIGEVYTVDTITIEFSSEMGATFQCTLDGAAWSDCAGPTTYNYLADGPHTFGVRATDAAGNTDPSPATAAWTVDTPGPDTSLDSTPPDPSTSRAATFTFSSADATHFECALDGAAFAACTSPHTVTGLADGPHLFEVRAVNDKGKPDATPAGFGWLVDATPPTVTVEQAIDQPDPATAGPIHFTVQFTEPVDGFADADVTLSGAAGATTAVVTNLHDHMEYDVAVSGMTGSGTVIATVAANVATDAAGNANTASTSTDNTVTYNAPAPAGAIYVTAGGGSVPGAGQYQKNDILKWNGSAWSVWFDGATRGMPATADIMAFDIADDAGGAVWLAVRQAQKLPGVGKTQPTQIVTFNGATWSLFFDGGDVGLKTTGEHVNGLEVLPGSVSPIGSGCLYYLLISTTAGGGVPIGAANVNFTGEDVLGFCMTSMGANTAGLWHVVFEGESQGLQKNNSLGLSAGEDGSTLYFTVNKNFTGDGGLIRPSELFSFSGGLFSGPLWRAADHGLNQLVDGIDVVGSIP